MAIVIQKIKQKALNFAIIDQASSRFAVKIIKLNETYL